MQILQSKNRRCLEVAFLAIFLVSLIQPVSAYDLNLSINSSSEFSLEQSNTYKFIVKNLNYTNGQEEINFTIFYHISNSTSIISGYPKTTNNSLKQQCTISRTFTPQYGGNFTICANLSFSTANDSNPDNDFNCISITVNQTANQEANYTSEENQTTNQTQTTENQSGQAESHEDRPDYEYEITNVPETIDNNNLNFTIHIKIRNNRNESKIFDTWSYIYRGSKCYSQDREENKKTIIVSPASENSTELENQLNLDEIKENNNTYKFKVKILRTEIKTPKEFTYNLTINITVNVTLDSAMTSNNTLTTKTLTTESKEEFLNGSAISEYKSKGEIAKGFAPYIFAVICMMTAVYIAVKKRI